MWRRIEQQADGMNASRKQIIRLTVWMRFLGTTEDRGVLK